MSEKSTGLWPTPQTTNRKSRRALMPHAEGGESSPPGLEQAVELSLGITPREMLWPTPAARMPGHNPTKIANLLTGSRHSFYLTHAVTAEGIMPGIITNGVTPASNQLTFLSEDFPASPIVLPVDVVGQVMTVTSGPISLDSFASYGPAGWSQRTSQGYSPVRLDGSLAPFSETWPRAGMTRSGIAYLQPPLAPLTDATGSGLWPTASATDGMGGPRTPDGRRGRQLRDIPGNMWPTPCAEDAKNVPYQKGAHGTRYPMLLGAVDPARMWPTPRAEHDSGRHRGQPDTLHSAVKMWPTPPVTMWRTPAAQDGMRGAQFVHEREGHCLSLRDQVKTWPTPTGSDWKGSGPSVVRKDGKMRNDRLDYRVEQWATPRANIRPSHMTYDRGCFNLEEQVGASVPGGGSLNPTWVELLMGFPPGWTDLT